MRIGAVKDYFRDGVFPPTGQTGLKVPVYTDTRFRGTVASPYYKDGRQVPIYDYLTNVTEDDETQDPLTAVVVPGPALVATIAIQGIYPPGTTFTLDGSTDNDGIFQVVLVYGVYRSGADVVKFMVDAINSQVPGVKASIGNKELGTINIQAVSPNTTVTISGLTAV